MAFVSRNPKTILNPETADGCIVVDPRNLSEGQEFIGFFKNTYTDPIYNNKCYVFKGKEDGKDYLFYGTTALHNEMAYYSIGDLVSIVYHGQKTVKNGRFSGKMAHIWKVSGETSWIPSPEFVQQLQQEVYNRRVEVQRQLSNPPGINVMNQQRPVQGFNQSQAYAVNAGVAHYPNTSVAPVNTNPYVAPKAADPFG